MRTLSSSPAIVSFTDDDVYKFRMAQLLFFRQRHTRVRFGFICRTKTIDLPKYVKIEELLAQIEHARYLRLTNEELEYLAGLKEFRPDFLEFLRNISELPPVLVKLIKRGTAFKIESEGPAPLVTFWETRVMRIIAKLYIESKAAELEVTMEELYTEGRKRLQAKLDRIVASTKPIKIIDFATRRRASFAWHETVVLTIADRLDSRFIGTSNLELARRHGWKPIGTMAHELDMIYQGVYFNEDRRAGRLVSHEKMLDDWWDFYGDTFSIALPDTYGYDYFYQTFGAERGRAWRGARHDSGDPEKFVTEHLLPFYQKVGVDPKTKVCVFSDGLHLGGELMLRLAELFNDVFSAVLFGVGTDISNDLGIPALSIVMKVIMVNGHHVGKLSGNIEKATGRKCAVARLKRLVDYRNTFSQACEY